jgi:hypothetical protein
MKMNRVAALFVLMLVSSGIGAQEVSGIATGPGSSQPAPRRGWNVHAAYVYGVIDDRYEVERQYKSGIGLGMLYRSGQWFSVGMVFTRFQNHEARSLTNCQAWTFDVDGQLSMRIAQSDLYFRIIGGVGYVDWKGEYIGPNLNDNNHYYFGKLLKDQFYTANMGWGFAHYFYRQRLEGFGDFRLKFAADPRVMFSIRDTQFQFGLRYTITDRDKEKTQSGNAKRKTNSEKKRKVYKWMKDRS